MLSLCYCYCWQCCKYVVVFVFVVVDDDLETSCQQKKSFTLEFDEVSMTVTFSLIFVKTLLV